MRCSMTELQQAFRSDFGKDGNPLGDYWGSKQIGDGRKGEVYIAELHHNAMISGRSVLSVWERLDGYEYSPGESEDHNGDLYPKENATWNLVFQTWFSDRDTAERKYRHLDPEGVEMRRENERPQGV